MLRVTLDTNTLDRIDEIRAVVAGRAIEIATTTVTTREKQDAGGLVTFETNATSSSRKT